MIVYRKSKKEFIQDCSIGDGNLIADQVAQEMRKSGILYFSDSEVDSWTYSLPQVADVLKATKNDDDIDVAIEYKINQSRKRIDLLIYGIDENNKNHLIVIELKQWSRCSRSGKYMFIHAYGGNGDDDYWHPSYQAYNYANIIENYNEYAQQNGVVFNACSYLHNMPNEYANLIEDIDVYPLINRSPVFLEDDRNKLASFIDKYVKHKNTQLLYEIDKSRIVPSKKLSDMLADSLKGNDFFSYDDGQANSVAEIVSIVDDALYYNEKKVVIIRGGAGTGKSIVALNALGKLISPLNGNRKRNAAYVVVNSAPRMLYSEELIKNDYRKKAIKNLFKYPTVFKDCAENDYDCLIVDEAHRVFDFKGGVGIKKGMHMLEKLMKAARVSVFLIDEDQTVTKDDYATIETIKDVAKKNRIRVIEGDDLVLTTQFRVLGGENYTSFIKYFLGYENAAIVKYKKNSNYDFRVFDKANDMLDLIKQKDEFYRQTVVNSNGQLLNSEIKSSKCRIVAGYCYNWNTPDKGGSKGEFRDGPHFDIALDNEEFKAKWNLRCKEVGSEYSWLNDPYSVNEIGCIYTCQGLDFNYCGVIIGKELSYKNGKLIYNNKEHAKTDTASGIRNLSSEEAKKLIRNTYNVLLTRGMLGTYVYCEDKGLRDYLKSLILEEQ